MADPTVERRCNATVDGKHRCEFRGSQDDLEAHAAATGHKLCRCCQRSLRDSEPTVCDECVQHTRDNLNLIEDACDRLPAAIENAGYLNEPIPGGVAMVILAGGNIEGGGPDDHIDFHDPIDPLAVLEHNERDWRLRFGHGPVVDLATIGSCVQYLLTWLPLAARTHPGFDDFAAEIRGLAVRLTHTAGVANDPVRAAAPCIDCDGTLISEYHGEPRLPDEVTRLGLPFEGREMHGTEPEPVWVCGSCSMIYSPVEYRLACRSWIETQAELAG